MHLAGRLPYRTSGLEWGKDREVLPITTWGAAMLPGYPARRKRSIMATAPTAYPTRQTAKIGAGARNFRLGVRPALPPPPAVL